MRVLLTGGYGCIGSWILRNLLERGDQVWIYDLKEDTHRIDLILAKEEIARATFIQGDVCDLPRLLEAIRTHQITHIIHLAGLQVPVCRADPLLGARVNVLGTLAVLEAARQTQGQVQRVVYASSSAVFGAPTLYGSEPLQDNVLLVPGTHYGVFKCCNEGNARIYFQDHGLSSVGLRPWTVYGVGRDFGMTSEPTTALHALAMGRAYHITYGGWQDLQYVDDVAKIFVLCLEKAYHGAQSFNLRGDVVDLPTFCKVLREIDPAAVGLISHGERQIPIAYNLDDGALERAFGPLPRTPLDQGCRATLDAFRRLIKEGRFNPTS